MNTKTQDIVEVHTYRTEGAWKHAKGYFRKLSGSKITQFERAHCRNYVAFSGEGKHVQDIL